MMKVVQWTKEFDADFDKLIDQGWTIINEANINKQPRIASLTNSSLNQYLVLVEEFNNEV